MYKEANGIFLRHLYQAAAEIMEPGQLAQLGAQAPSPDGNGPVALSGKESYLWLARVVAANGTQRHVTREMMRALQAEISGRLVVDEWHRDAGDLSGDGWKRGRSGKGHGNFTEMLEEVMAVLRPKFDCVCSFAPEVLAQVDEEVFLLSLET